MNLSDPNRDRLTEADYREAEALLYGNTDLAGLQDPRVPGLGEVSSPLPFLPTGEILNDPNPPFTTSDVTRAQAQAYKTNLTAQDNLARDLYNKGILKRRERRLRAQTKVPYWRVCLTFYKQISLPLLAFLTS